MNLVKRIAITGPESTGKSMLAQQLAECYHTVWVEEYAREYINNLNRPYNEEDILAIAQGQMAREDSQALKADKVLFCDTELIVTKIWSDVKYARCHPWILQEIERRKYDLFLLCSIDIPWENDPQREHPHQRQFLFDLYYKELTDRKLPFFVLSGLGEKRLENALRFIRDNCDI